MSEKSKKVLIITLNIICLVVLPLLIFSSLSAEYSLFNAPPKKASANTYEADIKQLMFDMRRTVLKNRNDPLGWYLLGRLCFSDAQYDCALDSFSKAYALDPENTRITFSYIQSLYEKNNHQLNDLSQQLINKILKKNPKDPGINYFLGMIHFENKDYKTAIKYWKLSREALVLNSPEYHAMNTAIDDAKALAFEKKKKQQSKNNYSEEALSITPPPKHISS